jgi:hypothetical protein
MVITVKEQVEVTISIRSRTVLNWLVVMLFQKVTDGVKTLKGNANNSRALRRKAITDLLWNHLLLVKYEPQLFLMCF